jgi:hypothetical protein
MLLSSYSSKVTPRQVGLGCLTLRTTDTEDRIPTLAHIINNQNSEEFFMMVYIYHLINEY